MAGLFGYTREAVRVQATKCEGAEASEYRKFSVDPQITSYEVLRSILAKAFDLQSNKDYSLSYRVIDDFGQETFLSLLSDWDLDAAFLSASEPCLCLQLDVHESVCQSKEAEEVETWDVPKIKSRVTETVCSNVPMSLRLPLLQSSRLALKHSAFKQASSSNIQVLLKNQVEKTIGLVQRALQVKADDLVELSDPDPVSDVQFRGYLDSLGTLVRNEEMRDAVFCAGVDPSLRKVVWKHLLNVYPKGLTGRERISYMKRKAQEYVELRDAWRSSFTEGQTICHEVMSVSSMVRKDVLRTDRHLHFYAGSDDNQNIAALFNVLTTYALNHPSVSYCQGMSDLASPLLVAMQDEPSAYVCFCALMERLQPNFSLDGVAMGIKFQHLSSALSYYDPDFHQYLHDQQASDLLFCYRWLLLELKREFAFEDALRMLEVLWASLPANYPSNELLLYQGNSPFKPNTHLPGPLLPLSAGRQTAYARLCAMRRRNARRLPANKSLDERQLLGHQSLQCKEESRNCQRPCFSLDDSDLPPSLDSSLSGGDLVVSPKVVRNLNEFKNFSSRHQVNGSKTTTVTEEIDTNELGENERSYTKLSEVEPSSSAILKSPSDESEDIFVWENPLQTLPLPPSPGKYAVNMTSSCEEALELSKTPPVASNNEARQAVSPWYLEQQEVLYSQSTLRLPPPVEFGGGNPFLVLLCVTLLRQHRDVIMQARMDYNELAMHLDRMVRRHNVRRVLREARELYQDYLTQFSSKTKGFLPDQSS